MDDIYILACLMQLVCVLTHTSEVIFKKKNHNMTDLKYRDAIDRPYIFAYFYNEKPAKIKNSIYRYAPGSIKSKLEMVHMNLNLSLHYYIITQCNKG